VRVATRRAMCPTRDGDDDVFGEMECLWCACDDSEVASADEVRRM
jgi:hypothetical protein